MWIERRSPPAAAVCYDATVSGDAKLLGLEVIVGRIDDALPVLTEGFGWTVAYDGESGDVAGRVVVLDAGTVTVTLLEPADSGPGLLSDRSPRVSQIVVGGAGDAAVSTVDRLVALGLPSHGIDAARRFVPPEVVAGVLGFETAFTVQVVDEPPAAE
ncbi:MAG: hypothetical protein AAF945_12470 [Actinomycetota bacterium]